MAKDPIKKANNGTYYFRANLGYDAVTGKQIQKNRSGFSTKKEARAEYSKLILAAEEGLAMEKKQPSFKQFIEEIYLPWYKTQVKESTYKNRLNTIEKHFKFFYRKKVNEIEPIHVQTWQLKLAKDYSPNYVRIIQGMLSLAFDRAIILGLAKKNPARMVGNIKSKKVKVDFWTLEEFQKVISLLYKGDYYEHYLFICFWLLFTTGLRIGEAAALQWEDIDFETGEVMINKSTAYAERQIHHKSTKTYQSRVPVIPDIVVNILKQWKSEQQRMCLEQGSHWQGYRGKDFDKNYVFIQENGKQMHPSSPYHMFKKIIRIYNENIATDEEHMIPPDATQHDLRHTAASILISNNMDPRSVAGVLGHSNPSTTLNIYSYFFKTKNQEAADIMKNSLFNAK